jgi:hypothetical protein
MGGLYQHQIEHRAQTGPPIGLQLAFGALRLRGAVFLGFLEIAAHPVSDDADKSTHQEGDAPDPVGIGLGTHGELQDGQHDCDQCVRQMAEEPDNADPGAALAVWGGFKDVAGRSAGLAPHREALDQAAESQHDGCQQAHRLMGGQQADHRSRPRHQPDRDRQDADASDPIG